MGFLQALLYYTFGALLTLFYKLTSNYGVALILFTIVTRALLFPLAIKQQKSTAEMVRMKPKLDELQKKYAKDKTKLNEENMKLYQEEGYNPLGGCLPMLIQLPIIMGLYAVIRSPLTYIYGLSTSQINDIISKVKQFIPGYNAKNASTFQQTILAPLMKDHANLLNLPSNLTLMKFDIGGIDLTREPGFKLSIYLLIPIFCYITQFLSSWLSIRMTSAANPQQAKGMNTTMIVFMPLMTTWFAVTVPASLGFYWVVSNVIMILQTLVLNKFFHPTKLAAIAQEKSDLKKQARLAGQIAQIEQKEEIDLPVSPQQKQQAISQGTKKPQFVQQNTSISKKKNQKKMNKYNNKKRLAAARENEKRNMTDKD
jgi:YidC/Oxa1 family membrane protein insertase